MNLKILRMLANKTHGQIANDLGIKVATYQQYEWNRREPNIDMLIKLADYFNVSIDRLVGRDEPTTDEQNLIFNQLNKENQKNAIEYMELLLKKQDKDK